MTLLTAIIPSTSLPGGGGFSGFSRGLIACWILVLAANGMANDKPAHGQSSSESKELHQPISLPSDLLPASYATREYTAPAELSKSEQELNRLRDQLKVGRQLRLDGRAEAARETLIPILESACPAEIHQSALLELGMLAEQQNEFSRAQQIYNQFLKHFSDSTMAPEILLRQGLMYRNMGAPTLALAKFYGVGSSAVQLKDGKVTQYQRLVRQAQMEIANTHFLQGKYRETIEFLNRLLKQETQEADRAGICYQLIQCYDRLEEAPELEGTARLFLKNYPNAAEAPEVRFTLANTLKRLGRNGDALQEVGALLIEQDKMSATNRAAWAYWQQRAGNEIANQLYLEGDYVNALAIYEGLLPLNDRADWQLPVLYQIGLVYERLAQAPRAEQSYRALILKAGVGSTNVSSALRPVVEMARWRADQMKWQDNAQKTNAFFGASKASRPLADASSVPKPDSRKQAP